MSNRRLLILTTISLVFSAVHLAARASLDSTSTQTKLVGYFCSSRGDILSRLPNESYTHIIVAFVASDQKTGELIFVGGEGAKRELIISEPVSEGIRAMQGKGVKVLLSFGGGTMRSENYAAWSNWIPSLADKLAGLVRNCPTKDGIPIQFDGLDIDWEDSPASENQAFYDGRKFLIELTKELRKPTNLPSSAGFLLTHTPQPPYLADHHTGMNGYIDVWNAVGDQIDWLQMQYYNNPGYQDPAQLLHHYRATINGWPRDENRPAFAGIPPHKLLVGKPIMKRDAGSGYIPAEQLISDVIKPLKHEYGGRFGGMFAWEITQDPNGDWGEQIAEALFD